MPVCVFLGKGRVKGRKGRGEGGGGGVRVHAFSVPPLGDLLLFPKK